MNQTKLATQEQLDNAQTKTPYEEKPKIQSVKLEKRYNLGNFEHSVITIESILPEGTTDPRPYLQMLEKAADLMSGQTGATRRMLDLKLDKEIKGVLNGNQ